MQIVEVFPMVWKTGMVSVACLTCGNGPATVRLTIQEAGGARIRICTCRKCIGRIQAGTLALTYGRPFDRLTAPSSVEGPQERRRLEPCQA